MPAVVATRRVRTSRWARGASYVEYIILVAVVLALIPAFHSLCQRISGVVDHASVTLSGSPTAREYEGSSAIPAGTFADNRRDNPASRGAFRLELTDNPLDPTPPTKPNLCYKDDFSPCLPGEIEPGPGPPPPQIAPSPGPATTAKSVIPLLPFEPGVNINVPADQGPSIQINVPPDQKPNPLINVPADPGPGLEINVPADPGQSPLINVPADQGPIIDAATPGASGEDAETARETRRLKLAGSTANRLTPGTPEHKAQRWQEYLDRGGTWDYDHWSKTYDQNVDRAKVAAAAADAYQARLGWGEREVTVDVEGVPRRLDIGDERTQRGVEVKTGNQYADQDNLWEIERDRILREQGWDIRWHFEGYASKPLKEALDKAGIPYDIEPQDPK